MKLISITASLILLSLSACLALSGKPNIVLIVCDDLNDYVEGYGGHPQAQTPHLARLAQTGVSFNHAYSNNPVCAPSRASFLTGIYPHTSGNLFWARWYENPVLKNSKTIMEYFRDEGYHVAGAGKLMHHHKGDVWSEYGRKADYGPFAAKDKKKVAHPAVPLPFRDIGPVDGSYGMLESNPRDVDETYDGWVYGRWTKGDPIRFRYNDEHKDLTPDEFNAQWAVKKIHQFAGNPDDQPFFLAVGFIRPHTPLHVAKQYFDRFPLEGLELPVIKPNDADDTYFRDVYAPTVKGLKYYRLLSESYPDEEAAILAYTQAYLACVAAVDECIGQVISAVDESGVRDNTIIVVTSDHGWNMGEKDFLFKNSPWEESTRVPLIIRAPGVAQPGQVVTEPVSLIDIYPTLKDLAGLRSDTMKNSNGAQLDGYSMRPLLENPERGTWEGPDGALTMLFAHHHAKEPLGEDARRDLAMQHWSLRTSRWRYILYNSGQEELYDHDSDPYEWTNVAAQYPDVSARMKGEIQRMTGIDALPEAKPE